MFRPGDRVRVVGYRDRVTGYRMLRVGSEHTVDHVGMVKGWAMGETDVHIFELVERAAAAKEN